MNVGVHESHCCKKHGCKYGDADCPVVSGKVKQKYPCEQCTAKPKRLKNIGQKMLLTVGDAKNNRDEHTTASKACNDLNQVAATLTREVEEFLKRKQGGRKW